MGDLGLELALAQRSWVPRRFVTRHRKKPEPSERVRSQYSCLAPARAVELRVAAATRSSTAPRRDGERCTSRFSSEATTRNVPRPIVAAIFASAPVRPAPTSRAISCSGLGERSSLKAARTTKLLAKNLRAAMLDGGAAHP